MKKYETVIILNPNLSSKVETFIKEFEKLLKQHSFSINKMEDIGRRQLSYSINNHNKGHYLIFNIEGDSLQLIDIENKIKYNESIIRHLFISVKEHSGEDSQLLIDSKNKKSDSEDTEEEGDLKKEINIKKTKKEKTTDEEESSKDNKGEEQENSVEITKEESKEEEKDE
jgi:small subunit ribosomal protein S6